jgi:hypothetical protein
MTYTIKTEQINPPVPSRLFDWQATLVDYEPGDAIGAGSTELDAVMDLMAQVIE